MRSSSVTSNVVLVGLVAGIASVYGCSSGGGGNTFPTGGTTGSAGSTSAAGSTGAAGSTATAGTSGAAGSTASAGTTGAAGSTASGGTTGAAGSTASGGSTGTAGAGTAGTTGTAGAVGTSDITKVAPTAGCGTDPTGFTVGQLTKQTIVTSGTKAANCADKKCGPWGPWTREYFVRLPTGYVKTKAYPLIIEGPGCGGKGNNLYQMSDLQDSVIRVGVSPSVDASPIHATNPGQGCFDDKDGDNSVDWPLYEAMWDKLAGQICFDKNRVFAGGNSSGAWFSNELGCRYAGDPVHPIRAVMPNTGGLPMEAMYKPTCTTKPMSGIWVHGTGDTTNPFTNNIFAMGRALTVNGCTPAGVNYQTATFTPYPISATDNTHCKKYNGCPDTYPLVVCPLQLNDHDSHNDVVNPAWNTFVRMFMAPPLLTQ